MNRSTLQSIRHRLKTMAWIAAGGTVFFCGLSIFKCDERFYSKVVRPIIFSILNPETAHRSAILAAKYRILPRPPRLLPELEDILKCTVFGIFFEHPVGLAAGFDKHGEAVPGLFQLGFSFVEVGSVTPQPQSGNEKPRVFRLLEDEAVINRYGFNSDGHEVVHERLRNLPENLKGVVGVSLGKNKNSPDIAEDYVHGVRKFADVAQFFVVNVSSPNTPGLRDLQKKEHLQTLIHKVVQCWKSLPVLARPPLLLKIDPDMEFQDKKALAEIILKTPEIVGIVVSNTTTSRPNLKSAHKDEVGGLSGRPLKDLSTRTVREMFELTKGQVRLIGVGGIFTGQDAYDKIKAGASLVQLYTSMVYEGPFIASKVKRELAELLRKDGFKSVSDAVGTSTSYRPSTP